MVVERLDPRPSAFVFSLRSVGYSLETAVADIIDNSIAAGCSSIRVFFSNEQDSKLVLIDDGEGMDASELKEAMRLGSKSPMEQREHTDLGRFGLGMKTASFSICKRLTVVSSNGNQRVAARWDLDEIATNNAWNLDVLTPEEINELPFIEELKSNGTAIIWEKIDKIIDESSRNKQKDLVSAISNLEKHLALTFHRYIEGEKGLKKLNIYINNHKIEAFDPFNKKNLATYVLEQDVIPLNGSKVTITPYILPHHSKTKTDEYEKYAGEGGYFVNQGFYVYRNKRLISHGGWFRIISPKVSTQLARVQIDISNELDDIWNIDVKKSVATPPIIIRDRLKSTIEKIMGKSTRVYEGRGRVQHMDGLTYVWNQVVTSGGKIQYKLNTEHPLIKRMVSYLEPKQESEFFVLLDMISKTFPTDLLFSQYSSKPKEVEQNSIDEEQLLNVAVILAQEKLKEEQNKTQILSGFEKMPPFNEYIEAISARLEKEGIQ